MNGPWRCLACGHPAIVHPLPTCGWHPEVDYQALSADRDRWKADAARLAAHGDAVTHGLRLYERNAASIEFLLSACRTFAATLAAHDALTAETEGK